MYWDGGTVLYNYKLFSIPENNLGMPFEVILEHVIQILVCVLLKGDADKHAPSVSLEPSLPYPGLDRLFSKSLWQMDSSGRLMLTQTWKQLTFDFSWCTLSKSPGDNTSSWLPFLIHRFLVPTGWHPGLSLGVSSVQSLGRRMLKIFHSISTPLQKKIQNFTVKLRLNISVFFTATTRTPPTIKHKRFIPVPLRTWFSLAHS